MKNILGICIIFFLAACGSSSVDKKNTNFNDVTGQDTTNTSSCVGLTNPGVNIYRTWARSFRQDSVNVTTKISFIGNQVNLAVTCQRQALNAVVQVQSGTVVANNQVQILNSMALTTTTVNPSNDKDVLSCQASINKSIITYSFKGPCLAILNDNGESVLWIPSI